MLLFTSIFSIRITITYLEKIPIIASRGILITIIIVSIFCFKFPAKLGEWGVEWKTNVAKIRTN